MALVLVWVLRPDGGSTARVIPPAASPTETGAATLDEAAPFRLAFPGNPDSLTITGASYGGWALLDRTNGATTGSSNSATAGNTVESMIKPWIVADYLRRKSEAGQQPTQRELDEITLVIIDSNDPLAEKYFQLGGADAVTSRMVQVCGLTNVGIKAKLWSWTVMTPLDAIRYGSCLADGRAAGPQWTGWLLDVMKQIRGTVAEQRSGSVQGGRWGIIDRLPPDVVKDISFKNGWTSYRDGWHVNCLAIHPGFVLSVMMRTYSRLDQAAAGCAGIAASLVVDTRQ